MISFQERNSTVENISTCIIDNINANLRVALPCIITSFNSKKQTCEAQPTIKGKVTQHDGKIESVNYPLLVDVPVIFPASGGVTMTFPVKAGDECLIVFADRCIDFWWQNGDIQESGDSRKHHLADGIAILGVRSVPSVIKNISNESMQIRSNDGSSFIELNPQTKNINVKTPSSVTVNAENIDMTAEKINLNAQQITLTSPVTTINGLLQINGTIVQGGDGESYTATFNGSIHASEDIKAGNISLQDHTHGGVRSGSNSTGIPE